MPYIIGLNSGSSFDGVDAVLCSIELAPDGHPACPKSISALTVDWPGELQLLILRAFDNTISIFEMTRLNYAAGAVYAEAVNRLLEEANIAPEDVDVIGYDGQTVYQEAPNRQLQAEWEKTGSTSLKWTKAGYPCGYFIVESGVVTALTNITTVTQFRPIDHALGVSGAPLMQYLDFVAFRSISEPVVTLNIGGKANLQLAWRDRSKMMAFDTGPGNVMIDHVVKARTGNAYDKDGELAAKGNIIKSLFDQLRDHPFYARKPPRSAWRNDFGSSYAAKILSDYEKESTEDLLATLTAFTADSITRSLTDFILTLPLIKEHGLSRIIASGGGTRNLQLMDILKRYLAPLGLGLSRSDDFGLPAPYKEAIKFATLAFACKRSLANNIPACGGASSFAVLGKLSVAPRFAIGAQRVNGTK